MRVPLRVFCLPMLAILLSVFVSGCATDADANGERDSLDVDRRKSQMKTQPDRDWIGGVPISVQLASGTSEVNYDGTEMALPMYAVFGPNPPAPTASEMVLDPDLNVINNSNVTAVLANGSVNMGQFVVRAGTLTIPAGLSGDFIVVVAVKNTMGVTSMAVTVRNVSPAPPVP